MSRDEGLEELIRDELQSVRGIREKAMFGGWAWLLNGNLLCGSRDDGMLVRLGKNRDQWALAINGVVPMISRGRAMAGWVRCAPVVYGDDARRKEFLSRAVEFALTLPAK